MYSHPQRRIGVLLTASVALLASCNDDPIINGPEIDTAAPTVVITDAPDASPALHEVAVSFTVSDDEALESVFVTWGTPDTPSDVIQAEGRSHSGSCLHTYETEGQFTIVVRAVDAAGNEASQSHVIEISAPLPAPPADIMATAEANQLLVEWTPGERATSQEVVVARPDGLEPDRVQSFADNVQASATFEDLAWGATYQVVVAAVNDAGRADSDPIAIQILTPQPPLLTRFSSAAGDPTCLVVAWEIETRTADEVENYRVSIVGDTEGDSFEELLPAAANDAELCAAVYPITDGMTYTARVFAVLGGAEFASGPLVFTVDFDPVSDATGVWHGEYVNSFGIPAEITLELLDVNGDISGTWAMAQAGGFADSGSLSGTLTGGHLELVLEWDEWDPPLSGDFVGPDLIEASLNLGLAVESMLLQRQ